MDTSILLIFALLSFSSFICDAKSCNSNDYNALVKIKTSLNITEDSWIPHTDCCNWNYVECNKKTNRVTHLQVLSVYSKISGQIPPAIGDLSYLEVIDFQNFPNLTGPIPPSIIKLKHLTIVWLSGNNLTGPVPAFGSEPQNLLALDLSSNHLSGMLPSSLSKLSMADIHLESNKLTGPIPDSFGRFTGLVPDLYLSDNELSGPIPKSLGDMNFQRIDLSRNKLVGDASMLFKPNGTAVEINLSRNELEFQLSEVKFPKTLITLDLSYNRIYGTIPKGMVRLDILQSFNVSYNRLCGEIPRGGNFRRFTASAYINNRCLCGPPLMKCK